MVPQSEVNRLANEKLEKQQDDFAAAMLSAIRAAGDVGAVEYDSEKYSLRSGNGGIELNLGNAWDEYRTAAASWKNEILKRWASSWIDVVNNQLPTFTRCGLYNNALPVIKPRVEFEVDQMVAKSAVPPFRVLAEAMAIGIAYDLPKIMAHLTGQSLIDAGVTFDEAMEFGLYNLKKMSRKPFAPLWSGSYRAAWDDNYDASRILLTDKIRALKVDGDAVAIVPNRGELLITGSNDTVGLRRILKLTEAAADRPRFMGGHLLRLDSQNTWVPFTASGDQVLEHAAKAAANTFWAQTYATQQQDLIDTNNFVASFFVHEQGSVCTWTNNVKALLPKTDYICLNEAVTDKSATYCIYGAFRWDDVARIVGPMLQKQNVWPARYLVTAFPDQQQITQLQSCTEQLTLPARKPD